MKFKKLVKVFVKVAIVLTAAAGVVYAVKKYLDKKNENDLFDDFDDFDDDFELDDEDDDDAKSGVQRGYVSLNITPESKNQETETEAAETKDAEQTSDKDEPADAAKASEDTTESADDADDEDVETIEISGEE